MPDSTLLEFARVNDALAATTKKLQKQTILAEFFRTLDDDDLRRAVRFAAGRPFAATDERTLNVGWSIVSEVVLDLVDIAPGPYHDLVIKSGEIGEALSRIWHERASSNHEAALPLTLKDLEDSFVDLAEVGSAENKNRILHETFSRCRDSREAAYLAKIIFRDMRTGVQEGVLQHAIAEAFSRDAKAIQRCQLLVGDLGEVAVLAKHDALCSARFKLFHPIQFMLATAQASAAEAAKTIDERTFLAEDKLDGIRAQVHKSGDRIHIYTRTMDRTDESFPDVVAAITKLPGEFLLDGEIVPYRDGQVLPFAHIQKRLGRKVLTPAVLRENPASFIAFDILYRDGELLMEKPLRERRRVLEDLAGVRHESDTGILPVHEEIGLEKVTEGTETFRTGRMPLSQLLITRVREVSTAEEIEQAFCVARDCRNEGLVLKDPESIYSPGRRGKMWFKTLQINTIQKPPKNGGFFSSTKGNAGKRVFSGWLKLKSHLPTLDCVVTAAEYGHGKRRNSLSDYTFAVWDREPTDDGAALVNVGKAYSGVTDEEIRQLTELFLGIATAQYGRVFTVPPKLVLEIAFDQIQKSKRHASGYAFRFPRIKRIRWDKRPDDADRLSRVAEIYESSANTGRAVPVADDAPADEPPKPKRVRRPKPPPEPSLFD